MRVLVTGATGFVGNALCAALAGAGHALRVVTRAPARAGANLPAGTELRELPSTDEAARVPAESARSGSGGSVAGTTAEWRDVVAGCDAIVNLAGESIAAGRWTAERKQALRRSRIDLTRALVAGCAAAEPRPRVLVSASAVGFYGPRGDEPVDERAEAGNDLLARLCVEWEAEAQPAEALGMRVVRTRFGVVLGRGGGALPRMTVPFKLFIGGPLGSGAQVLSWVQIQDVVGLLIHALEHDELSGALNATAPDARSNRDFSRALGAALGRPSWAPVPAFALRLALGEMAEMLLTGQRVVPARAQQSGYAFRHPRLEEALRASL